MCNMQEVQRYIWGEINRMQNEYIRLSILEKLAAKRKREVAQQLEELKKLGESDNLAEALSQLVISDVLKDAGFYN